jgi:hypothetical protein
MLLIMLPTPTSRAFAAATSQPADGHYLAQNAYLLELIADSRAKR